MSREEHHIPATTTSVTAAVAVEIETKHQPPGITTLPVRDTIQSHYCRRCRDKDNTNHLEHCKIIKKTNRQTNIDPNRFRLPREGEGDEKKGKDGRKGMGDEKMKGKMGGGEEEKWPPPLLASLRLVVSKE
ncbi:hypothetical protein L3X38_043262 [Prunus dulcis]|uniref:Uncharacterized protein n=1 Tax=Prunus dulcis TaxID=3755 RepID=A0AAD4UY85_PRUDU|nr:hypothetical protein L3X38_043262 [Prunus dulcis]